MSHALLLTICLTAVPTGDGSVVIENGQIVPRPARNGGPVVLGDQYPDSASALWQPGQSQAAPVVGGAGQNSGAQNSGSAVLGAQYNSPVLWQSPNVTDEPPVIAPAVQQPDVVFFASDSVEFELPLGWNLAETPWERDVFLQLAPKSDFSRNPRELSGGAWIRYRPSQAYSQSPDLEGELTVRLQSAVSTMPRTATPKEINVGGFPGMLQEFRLPVPGGASVPSAHLVIITPWGIFEMRATENNPTGKAARAAAAQILASLKFHQPVPGAGAGKPVDPGVQPAAELFGSWKAIHGRMQFLRDGRVAMEFDRRQVMSFDDSGSPRFREPNIVLIGHYTAEADVINVTWEDNSETNYRWARRGDDLLLTDHEGRTSQLAPLFD